jgi:hypothetical protein
MIKHLMRRAAQALLPTSVFQRIQAVRSRRHQVRFLRNAGISKATERYVELYGTVVRYGPFAGLEYPLEATLGRHVLPKLLGTYESELHPLIAWIANRRYDCVIDIGSAEGYYAVGLARLLKVPVYAFDPEPIERNLCLRMARLNGVAELINPNQLFTAQDVIRFADKRALVISDCEGFESNIFTETTVPLMRNWDVLIELHGSAIDSLPSLPWRGQAEIISPSPRDSEEVHLTELDGLGRAEALLSEYRGSPSQRWFWNPCDPTQISSEASITQS